MKSLILFSCLSGLALALLGCGGARPHAKPSTITLTGTGSSFVYPLMQRWTRDFHRSHPDITVNYQPLGSGAGIRQIQNATVDFGASDAALDDGQLTAMPPLEQVAESAGPVCISYNLPLQRVEATWKRPEQSGGPLGPKPQAAWEPQKTLPASEARRQATHTGVPSAPARWGGSGSDPAKSGEPTLRLTGAALAGIYLGTITRWNDPRIVATNPGVTLPDVPVQVIHRSDGSGTTSIVSHYLAAVSADWTRKVGAGVSVAWPVGLGGKGSAGVTALVRETPGAIGYIELDYAAEARLPVAMVQNAAGQFVTPSVASAGAAIAASQPSLQTDIRTPIVNAAGATSYPITGLTFLLAPREAEPAKRSALRQFLAYILGPGQTAAAALHYAPLPDSLLRIERERLHLPSEYLQPSGAR